MGKQQRAPFAFRMLYGPSAGLIDYAQRLDMNWVVIDSTGHKGGRLNDNPPIYLPGYPRLKSKMPYSREQIESERRRIRGLISHAKKAGLKVIYHAYVPSVPYGFQKAYPKLYSEPIREYRSALTPEQRERQLCVARPEVREVLSQTVAEICEAFPDLDGFMYSNNEGSSRTQCWHRCEYCRDMPFSRTMKLLHDAMKEGIERSGRPVRLLMRCWGAHDHDFHYYEQYRKRIEFGVHELEEKKWLTDYVRCFKPARLHFKPSRDIPPFVRSLKGEDTAFVYKATWADVNMHHPLNPWIGKYDGHDEIVEFSFEHTSGRRFIIMGREMQRRARLCARKGVSGICSVPFSWGASGLPSGRQLRSRWSLVELNMYVVAALMQDPDADLQKVTSDYLRDRYGQRLPAELARILLDSEDVAAEAINVRGIRARGDSLDNFYYEILRYAPMYPKWQQRVRPTSANMKRIRAEKAKNLKRAEKMFDRVKRLKRTMPSRAYRDFSQCFENLRELVCRHQAAQEYYLSLWALKDGYTKPTLAELVRLDRLSRGLVPRAIR